MKLSFEEIKKITFGAVRVWQDADGICFSRCTEKQEAVWNEQDPVLGTRARSTTGVRLDFHTNATQLSMLASHGR